MDIKQILKEYQKLLFLTLFLQLLRAFIVNNAWNTWQILNICDTKAVTNFNQNYYMRYLSGSKVSPRYVSWSNEPANITMILVIALQRVMVYIPSLLYRVKICTNKGQVFYSTLYLYPPYYVG